MSKPRKPRADLFGVAVPNLYEQTELLAGSPSGLLQATAELREKAARLATASRLRPDDEHLARRAAAAEREYLRLRDRASSMSGAEIAADRRACSAGQSLPTDNAELFG